MPIQIQQGRFIHFGMTIFLGKRCAFFWQYTEHTLNLRNSFFGICAAAIRPDITLVMVDIVVSKIVFSGAMLFDKESARNAVDPDHRLFCNDFKVVNVGTNVIVTTLIIS